MICTNCRKSLRPNARFCSGCGITLAAHNQYQQRNMPHMGSYNASGGTPVPAAYRRGHAIPRYGLIVLICAVFLLLVVGTVFLVSIMDGGHTGSSVIFGGRDSALIGRWRLGGAEIEFLRDGTGTANSGSRRYTITSWRTEDGRLFFDYEFNWNVGLVLSELVYDANETLVEVLRYGGETGSPYLRVSGNPGEIAGEWRRAQHPMFLDGRTGTDRNRITHGRDDWNVLRVFSDSTGERWDGSRFRWSESSITYIGKLHLTILFQTQG